ncbi:MAG: class I SAM-dependent methyltransferase [Rhodovibrio sp.]|nr:class I SAM-dependent methyltransferase [Rhodovibrio sp.]
MVKLSNAPRAPLQIGVICDKRGSLSSVLDIGGGHGLYTELVLRRYPDAEATILDLPAAIGYVRERFPRICAPASRCRKAMRATPSWIGRSTSLW